VTRRKRRDPLEKLPSDAGEPAEDLGLTVPGLERRPSRRRGAVRPSERRRRDRQLSVTFSPENGDAPERLRALALAWGWKGPDGRSANYSAVVEYLLMPQLEAAEAGKIRPPGDSAQ
jgi:hypothetical protein